MRKTIMLTTLALALMILAGGAAECLAPEEAVLGCWHGQDGGVLILLEGRQAVYAHEGIVCKGSYTLCGRIIYLDDLRPPAWTREAKWNYAVSGDVLLLWENSDLMIYRRGYWHGEN